MRIASALIVFLLGCGPDPAVIAQQEALLAAAERMIQAAEQALSKEDFRAVSDSLEAANQALYRADHKSLKDKVDTLAERIHRIGESNAALEKKAFEQSKSTFAGIIAQIEPLARGASAVDKPRVRGKILLWDGKNGIYPPHHQLPANLRATKPDDKMTIFLLGAKDWEYVGDYVDKKGGEPVKAYRHSWTVTVVYWPEKECAGVAKLLGEDPASIIFDAHNKDARRGKEITSTDFLHWLDSLPRD